MNIIVFDTETIGKVNQDLLNVGYKIIDVDIQRAEYTILKQRDYLVTSLINNKVYCINDDFVGAKKYNAYMELLNQKRIIKRSIPQIFKTLTNDLEKYHVLFGYAYNNNFDLTRFAEHAERFQIDNPMESIPQFDIWGYASHYICNTEDYKKWALENNQLTATQKYLSTTVESVTRYLRNDLNFEESHTALSDTHWEINILMECVKRGADITRPMAKLMPKSDKVLTDTLVIKGEPMEISYKEKYTRNGKTTYKE